MLNPSPQFNRGNLLSFIRAGFYRGGEAAVLLVFVCVSLFPTQALAFNNEIELPHLSVIFELDPTLEGVAVMGIEEFPQARTFARVLVDRSMQVRSSPAEGSIVRVLSTAYSSTTDQTDGDPFTTASGERVGAGTMAANFLPLGTKVGIGGTIYTVNDRMNARFNGKYVVDIWKPTRAEAMAHGARILEMEVVDLP